jgi:hypothetical protein
VPKGNHCCLLPFVVTTSRLTTHPPGRSLSDALSGSLFAMLSYIRDRNMDLWLPGFLKHKLDNALSRSFQGTRHILFAMCDHYEPLWGEADEQTGNKRVQAWLDHYPEMTTPFLDADGCHPKHSFFFPGEEYRPFYLESLAELARKGLGEVELHLHHDNDTDAGVRAKLAEYLETFAKHGHFSRDPDGRIRYAFIHGDWALANGNPDGTNCGVDNEMQILWETGCYCDMTFPAAPDPAQPHIVNKIYWPLGDMTQRRAYDKDYDEARVGHRMDDRILMLTGPLAMTFKRAKMPLRLENGHVTGNDPGTPERVATWIDQNIHVLGRPDWVFVKVYTHAAPEKVADSYLFDGGRTLHHELTTRYNDGERFCLHYVTAREMYNIAMAAMDGKSGNPNDYRDYLLSPPPL